MPDLTDDVEEDADNPLVLLCIVEPPPPSLASPPSDTIDELPPEVDRLSPRAPSWATASLASLVPTLELPPPHPTVDVPKTTPHATHDAAPNAPSQPMVTSDSLAPDVECPMRAHNGATTRHQNGRAYAWVHPRHEMFMDARSRDGATDTLAEQRRRKAVQGRVTGVPPQRRRECPLLPAHRSRVNNPHAPRPPRMGYAARRASTARISEP
jgi:hypothetical protein